MGTLTKEDLANMSDKDFASMNLEQLSALKTEIDRQVAQNEKDYNKRYDFGNNFQTYGDSINDDYNGERAEYTRLSNLQIAIYNEIKKQEEKKIPEILLLTIEETIKKQSSDFKNRGKAWSTVVLTKPCPICGSPVICAHDDMSADEINNTYNHICQNSSCEYILKHSFTEPRGGYQDIYRRDRCPFCEREVD